VKRKRPTVIVHTPYTAAKMEGNLVYVLDRDIRADAKDTIQKFELELQKHGMNFAKKKIGKYYRYWIVFMNS